MTKRKIWCREMSCRAGNVTNSETCNFGFLLSSFLALLGMDPLEHLGHQFHLGAWNNGERIAVEMDGTPLVLGLWEHLSHGLQHAKALVSNDQPYSV